MSFSEYQIPLWRKAIAANRGEIACRVIKTAPRAGIATIAACWEADARD